MAELRRFFADVPAGAASCLLSGEEFAHMTRVLRHRVGDRVLLLPGDGREITAEIAGIERDRALLSVLSEERSRREPRLQVDLFQAVCKGDKMELITQKAVELGARAVRPFTSRYTVAQGDGKRERLVKIADEAVKQCRRAVRVPVSDAVTLEAAAEAISGYDLAVLLYENESRASLSDALRSAPKPESVALFVGSEGGFSEEEAAFLVSRGARCASLGRRTLRAETAAVAALTAVMYEYGELGW